MIKSDVFYPAFTTAFEAACTTLDLKRRRGKVPKFDASTAAGKISFWFKVNPKASALPYQPGEFWPDIHIDSLRYNQRDDGTISWYQYTNATFEHAMLAQQQLVADKVAAQENFDPPFWREFRDSSLGFMHSFIANGFRPGWPHTSLYYFDEQDAAAWGSLLGGEIGHWLEGFAATPETLEAYMWRTHWNHSN